MELSADERAVLSAFAGDPLGPIALTVSGIAQRCSLDARVVLRVVQTLEERGMMITTGLATSQQALCMPVGCALTEVRPPKVEG